MDTDPALRAKLKRLFLLPRWKMLLFIFILNFFVLLDIVYIFQMKTICKHKEDLIAAYQIKGEKHE